MDEIDFFLSHNKAERDWTEALAKGLRKQGASVFLAEDSIAFGDDIVVAIENALNQSKQVILVLSKASIESQWVEMEWASSLLPNKNSLYPKLVPILLEDCDIPLLLRRLNYIDARDGNCEIVIEKLLKNSNLLKTNSESKNLPTAKIDFSAGEPVPFGSVQYVERAEDRRLRTILERGESAFLYGPVRIGKTSMMHRVLAREALLHHETFWLDISTVFDVTSEKTLENIAWVLARELGEKRNPHNEPIGIYVANALRRLSASSEFTLLIDEVDLLGNSLIGEYFLNIIRQTISDPHTFNFRCICAGHRPPWKWQSNLDASPWWSMFHLLRLAPFSIDETRNLLALVGLTDIKAVKKIFTFTGGHPQLVSSAALQIQEGKRVGKVIQDYLLLDGPFSYIAINLVQNAIWLAGERTDFLRDLLNGDKLKREEDIEALWEAGIISDSNKNPPRIVGSLFKNAVEYMLKRADNSTA